MHHELLICLVLQILPHFARQGIPHLQHTKPWYYYVHPLVVQAVTAEVSVHILLTCRGLQLTNQALTVSYLNSFAGSS